QFTPSPPEARRRRGGRPDEFAPLPVRASRREGTRAPGRIWTASSPFQNVLFAACGHAACNNPSGIHVRCRPGALAGRLFQRAARHFCPETPKKEHFRRILSPALSSYGFVRTTRPLVLKKHHFNPALLRFVETVQQTGR